MTMPKFAKEEADKILGRLDRTAHTIQTNFKAWGMPFDVAKSIVNDLDKTADEVETAAFGAESFQRRVVEVATKAAKAKEAGKTAEIIQRDQDESYMDAFRNPQAPVQIEGDEPYMKEYGVDQSSEVHHGKSTTGRPLAP